MFSLLPLCRSARTRNRRVSGWGTTMLSRVTSRLLLSLVRISGWPRTGIRIFEWDASPWTAANFSVRPKHIAIGAIGRGSAVPCASAALADYTAPLQARGPAALRTLAFPPAGDAGQIKLTWAAIA